MKSRREFVRDIIAGAAGALVASTAACDRKSPQLPASGATSAIRRGPSSGKPRLVVVTDPKYAPSGKRDASRIRRQLEMALAEFTGAEQQRDAWRTFFDPGDVVGLKINCLSGREMSSHPEIATAIAQGLRKAGLTRKQVIAWDRMRRELIAAGYEGECDDFECAATDDDAFGYEPDVVVTGEVGACFSRILTARCTAAINVPLVKDHGIVGITCALKNWLGAISNPNKLHHNRGDPMIADLNVADTIRSAQKLIVCDAFDVLYHGGPSYKPEYITRFGGIIVGTDAVALDMYAWQLIEEQRAKAKLPTLAKERREPTYIARAADEEHRLGEANLDKVEIVRLNL